MYSVLDGFNTCIMWKIASWFILQIIRVIALYLERKSLEV